MGRSASGWIPGKRAVAWAWVAGLLISAGVEAREETYARVSFDGGGGLVKGIGEADWSYLTLNGLILPGDEIWVSEEGVIEVEMAGGTFLRMADVAHAGIVSLPPSALLRAWVGAFYVQRLRLSSPRTVIETPLCRVVVERLSQVRIDVFDDGGTTVSVWQGSARIQMDGTRDVLVMKGWRSYIDPGYLPSLPERFDVDREDDFDRWNRERSESITTATDALPSGIGFKDDVVGASDLSTYGDWIQASSEYCWRPNVEEDFVPYREGYWSYVSECGYVWVGRHPFSYITTHYGRWMYEPDAGWFWVYRGTWAPAWAATLRFGSTFLWCPLDPSGCPVATSTSCFAIGGMHFGVYAATCCDAEDLLGGRCRPYACTPTLAEQLLNSRPEIWRIVSNVRNQISVAYNDPSMHIRDYAPRRVIRGTNLSGPGRQSPHACVVALESRVPRAPETDVESSGVKTPATAASRPERVRKVRIDTRNLPEAPKIVSRDVGEDASGDERKQSPRVVRVGVSEQAEGSDDSSRRQPAAQERKREIRPVSEEPPSGTNTDGHGREPTPARTIEETPSQPIVESPAPSPEPQHVEPQPRQPVETAMPTREIRHQVSEPTPEPVRAIRSEPESKPSPPPERPAPAPVEQHNAPSPPAPTRVVETPPAATSSSRQAEDSSRSIRSGRQ